MTNVSGTNLVEKLSWLNDNVQSDTSYIIEVNDDEVINEPHILGYDGKSNVTITLKGIGETRRSIKIAPKVSVLFTIHPNVTLILDENICLYGKEYNNMPLIAVFGSLIMNTDSGITGNTNKYKGEFSGSAVFVGESGIFTMNGGGIFNNKSIDSHGAVCVSGTFIMNGGTIGGHNHTTGITCGGGVYLGKGATFTMHKGTIICNRVEEFGGGVYVSRGAEFTMNGGTININQARFGGGVLVRGIFNMKGGLISGNEAYYNGGGICVDRDGYFAKTGGTIKCDEPDGNRAALVGHGVGNAVTYWLERCRYYIDTTVDSTNNISANEGKVVGEWQKIVDKISVLPIIGIVLGLIVIAMLLCR